MIGCNDPLSKVQSLGTVDDSAVGVGHRRHFRRLLVSGQFSTLRLLPYDGTYAYYAEI